MNKEVKENKVNNDEASILIEASSDIKESESLEKKEVQPEVKIVKTDEGNADGQTKCPKCGATDISLNVSDGKLRCNFCRHEFEAQKVDGLENDIWNLKGKILGSGAQNINSETSNMITIKCSSCGAEVVIDSNDATSARCHWCRNVLSINEQIPNGAVPDVVLPFGIKKEEARKLIEEFVGKRKFYAHPKFKNEFTTENIMGVYLPYMIVDMNAHSSYSGQGEVETRSYYVGDGDNRTHYYDADLYDVERDFDIAIEGLTVESSLDKLDHTNSNKTNNIINAILPFDVENCVKWDANYLKGFSSEKRDTNIDDLALLVNEQTKDISRHKANDTLEKYDRGVRWDCEELKVKGEQWKSAYLPVWLYSYQEVKKNGTSLLHYVAVNSRTKETIGSVPIHKPRLFAISGVIELISIIISLLLDYEYDWIICIAGILYYFIIYGKYRNSSARHNHESETKAEIRDIKGRDVFVEKRKRLRSSIMDGANNDKVDGTNISKDVLSQIKDKIKVD